MGITATGTSSLGKGRRNGRGKEDTSVIITQGNVSSIRINLSCFEIAIALEKWLDAVQILYLWGIVGDRNYVGWFVTISYRFFIRRLKRIDFFK